MGYFIQSIQLVSAISSSIHARHAPWLEAASDLLCLCSICCPMYAGVIEHRWKIILPQLKQHGIANPGLPTRLSETQEPAPAPALDTHSLVPTTVKTLLRGTGETGRARQKARHDIRSFSVGVHLHAVHLLGIKVRIDLRIVSTSMLGSA